MWVVGEDVGHRSILTPRTGEFGDDGPVDDSVLPRIPASAGALIGDGAGRILILKPTYKSGWTIPGGQIEADGESPWEGCRREVVEETGLVVNAGRLVCVDFLRPKPDRPGGLRFVFDCGSIGPTERQGIVVDGVEISEHRFAKPDQAARLLSGPVGRRVAGALAADGFLYLEDGRPVPAVTS
jgi:8-oxo-dGTP pyrophosphatase MutT (NUDIX family)